jgi:putative transposase
VRLTAKVKLETNKGSFSALEDTLREANRCCNWISDQAWNAKVFAQFKIHQLCYRTAREQFPRLASQVIIRCIAKVSDSYSLDKETKRTYRLNGAIAYDLRILRWYVDKGMVSIWTTSGRLKIPFVCGPRQKELLKSQQGESDLILRKKAFYLAASCNIDNPPPGMVDEFLGVDVGITNLAVDSDGNVYSGSAVKSIRHRHRSLRAKLQKKGTRAAKRKLKKLSGKERRFATNTNHVISKQIVSLAKGTGRGIALENLKGIRDRITVRKAQRAVLHSWACYQLRTFLSYKAEREGVPEQVVDPRNSSRECCECGHVDKRNRPTRDQFCCLQCGSRKPADWNAAIVISGRAVVNTPNVAGCESSAHDSVASPPL